MDGQGEHFDVAVVGARCAGAPLATMLAKRGMRVCLYDRATFPSDTPSTHVIQPSGVMALARLGVLDDLYAAGAVPIIRLTLVHEDVRIDAEFGADTFGVPGLSIRRVTLDELLVRAAAAAGAEVRTGSGVIGLLREEGRVRGVVTGRGSARASVVVGADGRRSTVADLVGAARYRVTPPARVFAWAYFDGVSETEGHLRLGRIGDLALLACPTDGGLHMAGACPPQAARTEFLADREAGLEAGLGTWPELADLLVGARRIGPVRTVANWDGFLREAAGPGWVLLGDAGHFKDPTPAQGIADALRQAEHLAEAIEAGLGGAADLDAELEQWWRWRDRDASEMYRFASDMGASLSPIIAHEVLGEVAADPEATLKFLGVLNHDIAPAELFTAGRIVRAVGRAVRRHPRRLPAIGAELGREAANELRHFGQLQRSRLVTPPLSRLGR
jgi:2-polyprenyl-6-methoxyphenol hydroxylase-like FAD-dependent oxidoreductase